MKITRMVMVSELEPGMVIAESLYDENGNILLSKGVILKQSVIDKVSGFKMDFVKVDDISVFSEETPMPEAVETTGDKEHSAFVEEARARAKNVVKQCLKDALVANSVNGDMILEAVRNLLDDILNQEEIVINLTRLQEIDDYLFEHSVNVSIYAIITGIMMGLNKEKLMILGCGALMHDVGKIALDNDILNKPDFLSDSEYEHVKSHAEHGYNLLIRSETFPEEAAKIALHHHERINGKGYPRGDIGSEISILAKIVAVVDVFDALTSDRVYSKRVTHFKAMEYICSMIDVHFDEAVAKSFLKTVGYFYRGLVIQLSNGDIGIVTRADKALPTVRIAMDSRNQKVTSHFEVDLKKNPSVRIQDVFIRNKDLKMDDIIDQIS